MAADNVTFPRLAGGNHMGAYNQALGASPSKPRGAMRYSSGSSSGRGTMQTKWGSGHSSNKTPADFRGFASPRTVGGTSRSTPRATPRTTPSRSRPRSKLPSLASTPRPATPGGHTSRLSGLLDGPKDSVRTPHGFLKRSSSEECIKCMLKVPHDKCEAHKYIRVGGGYRHSYWYVKAMLEEIELRRQKEALLQKRLDAIREKEVRAVKTYIRTKSGRLVERVIFMSEDDYAKMRDGGQDIEDIIKKYLSKDEAEGLQNWDREEQKAITTYIRTKSGRRVEKVIYVSKTDYDKIKGGKGNANKLLEKYMDPNEGKIEGWGEAQLTSVKTFIRTNSGRLVEKTIMVTKEDYEKMQELKRQGKDPNEILQKYMAVNAGETIEGFAKNEAEPMRSVRAMVRTKSGKLVEKTILMTEEEFREFEESGGDMKLLRKFMNIGADDVIEDWEKASTVFDGDDDEAVKKGIPGTRIIGKDGTVYEIVEDPVTGKKYKKKVKKKESDNDSGFSSVKQPRGKVGKGHIVGAVNEEDPFEKGMSKEQKVAYRAGKRNEDSDSEYSYRSVKSAGGTRHVMRRRRKEDGTYSDEEEYNSDKDEEGKKRRQERRKTRKVKAIKVKKEKLAKGGRNDGSDSDFSYRSVVSAGGTRHVKRKKKNKDGTYGDEESYHSSQDEDGMERRKNRRKKKVQNMKKGKRDPGSDSDFSYRSVVSAGGTRHVKRKRRNNDGTYGDEESYHSSQDEDGKARRKQRRGKRQKAFKGGKRRDDSDSDFSYRSVISAGGTRHVKRKKKLADGTYGDEESYHSSQDGDGEGRRRRRRRERKHAGSAHSYYSTVSDGGTRHVRRKKKKADGGYEDSESYHSGDSDMFEKKRKKKRRQHGSDSDYSYYSDVSKGGTKTRKRKQRIKDKTGKVIGYGKAEVYSSESDSDESVYEMKPDGKGGYIKVKKKGGKKGKAGKGGKGGRKGGGPDGNMTDFSDDLQSTDSEDEPDLSKMTKEEKKAYMAAKAKRKEEREKKRREKYGEKYEEMVEKHKKAKEAKSMVSYEKGKKRFEDGEYDERGIGLGHDDWGKKGKKGKKKGGDGNEADDESDASEDHNVPIESVIDEPHQSINHSLSNIPSRGQSIEHTTDSNRSSAMRKREYKTILRKQPPLQENTNLNHVDVSKRGSILRLHSDMGSQTSIVLNNHSEKKKVGPSLSVKGEGVETPTPVNHRGIKRTVRAPKEVVAQYVPKVITAPIMPQMTPVELPVKAEVPDGDGSEDGDDIIGGRRRKKKGEKDDDEESLYEIVRDKDGNIMYDNEGKAIMKKIGTIKKKRKGQPGEVVDSDDEFQYKYDEKGNLVRKKKGEDDPESDGDYFETAPDGTVKLKAGKKKIDINKLKDEDLRKLGLDPDKMSKQEIARALKEMFGDEINITKGKQKVGLKALEDMDPGMDTDDLANDSDLDTSTIKGQRKVRVLMRKGGQKILDHMKKVIDDSALVDEQNAKEPERDASIDFLQHYRLVDATKIDIYAKPFVVEDDNMEGVIPARAAKDALEGIPTINHVSKKQMDYIWRVLDLHEDSRLTFRMFAVMTALAERVTAMDAHCKHLLEIANLTDIERKMALYKAMFYCNNPGDRNPNYIKSDSLRIELMAGGLNWDQQEYVMDQMQPTEFREISFIDYLCYIPLFLSMHDKMCDNPLDMSNTKYMQHRPASVQRDMNPLGYPLKRTTAFIERNSRAKQLHKKADDLLSGKKPTKGSNEGMELFNKYQKLPHIIGGQETPFSKDTSKSKSKFGSSIF